MIATATSATTSTSTRQECNRRRRDDLVVRGATERYTGRLKGLGCLYDPRNFVWLAPSTEALAQIGTWPGLRIGTEGPRLPDSAEWPAWCRGWAIMDLPPEYAARWVDTVDDPEMRRWMQYRADGNQAKGREYRPRVSSTIEATRRMLQVARAGVGTSHDEWRALPSEVRATYTARVTPGTPMPTLAAYALWMSERQAG